MRPGDYDDYAAVYDYFSEPRFNGQLKQFAELLVERLPETARVVDAGGGTGLLCRWVMDRRPDLRWHFVEPSVPMARIARDRLGDRVTWYTEPLEQVLGALAEVDAFIFARSLYAFHGNVAAYGPLFRRLIERLGRRGHLCIYELEAAYHIDAMRSDMRAVAAGEDERARFDRLWPVFASALERFNTGLVEGRFHLFTEDELGRLAQTADLEQEQISPPFYFFRKALGTSISG